MRAKWQPWRFGKVDEEAMLPDMVAKSNRLIA
jgi:hypothetical protein